MINGDKSQDIGDAERRSLIEIKEAIVRVQTAPAMDIIAEKDLADKDVEAQYFNTLKYVEAMSNGAWKKNPKILKEMRGDKGEIEDFIFRPDFHVKSIHLIYAESKEGKKKYLSKIYQKIFE